MPTATETPPVVQLVGTKANPAHEPKAKDGKGSIGDKAFMDALYVIVLALALLGFLAYSLRHHNV